MRLSRDHLTFKALAALDEAAEATGPVPKSFALRFALAYLYAISTGERWMFDEFWRRATEPCAGDFAGALARRQSLNAAFNGIWGWQLIPQIAFGFNQYCRKYNTSHDRMAPFILNQRRNGLLNPEGYHFNHRREVLTVEDYLAARWICKPMSLLDCDMPIQTAGAFLITTAERARHMKQKPIYILNHCSQRGVVRSSCETLDETEEFTDHIARMCYEGSGLSAKDIDIFNPYDGFTLFFQYFLEGFQWRGVKRGEAHDFYAGDISVEGPNPLSSSGGNCGNGRTRWWGQRDCIQQLRGQAGYRQVRTRHETAIAGAFTAGYSDWVVYSTHPN